MNAEPDRPASASSSSIASARAHGGRLARRLSAGLRVGLGLIPDRPEYSPTRRRRAYLLAVYIFRRWLVEDGCAGKAAMLTIHTLLSTVPIIGVALTVVGLMDEAAGERLMRDLFRSVVFETGRADDMADAALELAAKVTIGNLGAWGFIVALFIAFALFQTLEGTINRIWRATRTRPILVKFTIFYTLATLGPLVILYSLAQPFLPGVSTALGIPWVLTTVGLVAILRFLPYTDVGWRGPVLGGAGAAVILELGKWGFGLYATRFALRTYEGMYGPLAILPILVIWSYVSWMVVLLGAEIAFVVQRRRTIAQQGYMNRYVLDRFHIQRPSGRTAAHLLLAICDQFSRREVGLDAQALAERFGIAHDLVLEILTRFARAGMVVQTDQTADVFVPARPLEQLHLIDVIQMFDEDLARHTREDRLWEHFEALDRARAEVLDTIDYESLVAADRPQTAELHGT